MSEEEIQNILAVNRSINDMEQNFRKKIEDLQQRINKVNNYCEKQKVKMYKNRNKIAMFNLIKIEKILKGDFDV